MKLYFQHANKELEFIAEVDSYKTAWDIVSTDLNKRAPHFKVYYVRQWTDDQGCHWFDVGDWSCFYVVKND